MTPTTIIIAIFFAIVLVVSAYIKGYDDAINSLEFLEDDSDDA